MVNANQRTAGRGLREQSRRVLDDVKQLGSIATDSVGEGTLKLKQRGRELLHDGKEKIDRYGGEVKKYVVANPMKAVLMAIGVGALLAITFRRRP